MAPGTPLVRVDLVGFSDDEALAVLSGEDKGAHHPAAEISDGAMLLIEEAAGLSLRVQTALLRLLKTGAGEHHDGNPQRVPKPSRRFQVNAIAMSDRDLAAEVAAGRFRHDLYFALARIVLDLPPLRERMQDLAPAAVWIGNRVLRNAGRDYELMTAEEFGRASSEDRAVAIELRPDAIEALQRHTWPGNFRELEAVLERALMLYRKGQSVGAAEIDAAMATAS
jgi:DNA-binding NtrC family response regulator